jgi:hypothetical protein
MRGRRSNRYRTRAMQKWNCRRKTGCADMRQKGIQRGIRRRIHRVMVQSARWTTRQQCRVDSWSVPGGGRQALVDDAVPSWLPSLKTLSHLPLSDACEWLAPTTPPKVLPSPAMPGLPGWARRGLKAIWATERWIANPKPNTTSSAPWITPPRATSSSETLATPRKPRLHPKFLSHSAPTASTASAKRRNLNLKTQRGDTSLPYTFPTVSPNPPRPT